MVPSDQRGTLVRLVAGIERQCMDTWRNAHAPKETVVDALALRATGVDTKISRKLGGNVSITVSIEARDVKASEEYWFKLQRTGKRDYRVVLQDSTLA